jgi:nicotinamidase-related amidase
MEVNISPDGFINMLMQQNGGALIDELDRELIKGVDSILDFGGNSSITLKINVQRLKDLESAVMISHDVVAKHPKEDRPKKAMFITTGNGLSDQQQDQEELELGEPVFMASVSKLTAIEKTGESK